VQTVDSEREASMAKKLDPKETVDIKELILSEVIQLEALINVLESKGIITKQELLEEIKRVAAKMPKAET
jgi:hypothetical protein